MDNIIDASERLKALDPTESFLVQAPAGSGKTELLIQRYLNLLGGVEHPQQIISMTFTRKAADEMKKRVLAALKRGLNETPPDSNHQRKTWELARLALKNDTKKGWRLLENPNQFKILTIDSFCAGIIKQMPILSCMGGPLEIIENADILYRETAKNLLSKIESNDSVGRRVRTILKHLDNSKSSFLLRINQLLLKRDQWMIPFFDEFEINDSKRNYFETVFSRLIESILIDLHTTIPIDFESIIPIASFAGINCAKHNTESPIAKLASIKSIPGYKIDDLYLWKGITELILTRSGITRNNINISIGFPTNNTKKKNDLITILKSLAVHETFLQKLHEVRLLPDPAFTDNEWKFLKSTLLLLPDIAETLRSIFSEQRKTDFTEISLSARDALGTEDNPTDLLLYLDHKIQHILVDEYQDISYKQYDLLLRLTSGWTPDDGRTMFIVGDPMQSIYRFRDAEVGLFLKTKDEGIGQIKLKYLSLQTNFRSQKPIVDWVNDCFGLVFPKTNNQDLGAITYSSSKSEQTNTTQSGVSLHATEPSSKENEAIEITKLVLSLKNQHPDKSIAILVRTRNHLPEIIRQFHIKKIRFRAEDIYPLTSRPEIMDLMALMRALTSINDRVAWLAILRAPWCGLSLEDLHRICSDDKSTPILLLLQDTTRIKSISTSGQNRIKRILSTLTQALTELHTSHFRDLLEGCWIHLGGPACTKPEIYSDLEIFFDKVSDFLESNELSNIEMFQVDITSLFANSWAEEDNTVQIMTMHKAKGLEFDFVIIPSLEKTAKAEDKRLIYWMPHGDDLLVAPIEEKGEPSSKVYEFLSRFNKHKSEFEALRLLYVAATRSKSQLHLFGQFLVNNDSSPRKGSLLKKLWPFIRDKWPRESDFKNVSALNPEQPSILTPKIWRLQENYELPPIPSNIEMGIISELQEESEAPEFLWAGNGARCLGNVMHRCFQILAEEGKESWTKKRIEQLELSLPAALKSQGLSQNLILVEIKKGTTMLRNIVSHKEGQWILESHQDARCEYSLTQIVNNTYQSKIIDRTFIDKNNTRWIIDYKTGQHMGADMEVFFKNEMNRYRPQLNQYENLFKLSGETRVIKKALYYPMHKELLLIE